MRAIKKADHILIRGANWLGDAVMTLPTLKAVAENYPTSTFEVLAVSAVRPIYENAPFVKSFLVDDKKEKHRGWRGRLALCAELKRNHYDLAVLFQNAFGAAAVTWLAGISQRLGYARDGRGLLLTHPAKISEVDRFGHEAFYYLNILKQAGLKAQYTKPVYTPSLEAEFEAKKLLEDKGLKTGNFLLALAPGAAYGSAKRWPEENFAAAARLILEKYPAGRVLILGGPNEVETAERIAALVPAINLAGQCAFDISAAALKQANLLLTNDSGLMHLAGALDVPLAAAFGPTSPLTTAPLGELAAVVRSGAPCSPCLKRECPLAERICFDGVGPEEMAKAALGLLNRPPKSALAPAVFLDRDGTINTEVNYLSRPEDLKLLPGAAQAIGALNRAGFKVVLVSNQSGLARGFFTPEELENIHVRLKNMLAEEGAHLDGIYYCPHHPEGIVPGLNVDCQCRKPNSYLFKKGAEELGLDIDRSFFVGDRLRDLAFDLKGHGRRALVLTGYGLTEAKENILKKNQLPDIVAPDLARAVEWILSHDKF